MRSLISKFLALYFLFKDQPEKVIEVIEESDYFLYEEEERKQRIITIEGGDIMMIHPTHLLVGCSERTSASAINEIIHTIFNNQNLGIEKISVVKIPKKRAQMHIDTIFTQVKRNVWVLYGRYSDAILKAEEEHKKSYLKKLSHVPKKTELEEVEIFQFFKKKNEPYVKNKDYSCSNPPAGLESLLRHISEVDFGVKPEEVKIIYSGNNEFPYDEREQWTDSSNVVALKEGVVIAYDRNDKTTETFKNEGFTILTTSQIFEMFENGVEPHSIEDTVVLLTSAELSRARGGSHCMSMPLLRDNWK